MFFKLISTFIFLFDLIYDDNVPVWIYFVILIKRLYNKGVYCLELTKILTTTYTHWQ